MPKYLQLKSVYSNIFISTTLLCNYGLALLHLFKYIHFNYATTLLRSSFVTFIQIYSFQLRYYGLALLHLFKYIHFSYATTV